MVWSTLVPKPHSMFKQHTELRRASEPPRDKLFGIMFVQFLVIVIHCTSKQHFKNFKQQIPIQIFAVSPTGTSDH